MSPARNPEGYFYRAAPQSGRSGRAAEPAPAAPGLVQRSTGSGIDSGLGELETNPDACKITLSDRDQLELFHEAYMADHGHGEDRFVGYDDNGVSYHTVGTEGFELSIVLRWQWGDIALYDAHVLPLEGSPGTQGDPGEYGYTCDYNLECLDERTPVAVLVGCQE